MSELTEYKKSLDEVQEGFVEVKRSIEELKKNPALKDNVDFQEKQRQVDAALDKHEDRIKAIDDLENEVAKLKANTGYSDEQKAAKEASLKAAFNLYVKGGIGSNLHADEAYKKEVELFAKANGNISGEDAAGGFLVRPEQSNDIINRVFESSPMRAVASAITIGTNEYTLPIDWSETESGKRAETEAFTETEGITLDEIRIPVHEQFAYPKISQHLLDDAVIDFEAYISDMVSQKFARDEATDFIRGNGVKRAKGILSYPDYADPNVDEVGALQRVPTETLDAVDYEGSVELIDSLFDEFQGNAVFMMKRQTRTKYRRLTDNENRPLWEPSLQRGVPSTWLGFPIFAATDFDPVEANGGSNGNIVAAFGDFARGYQIVDRIGMRIIRDNITKPGFVRYIMSRRVGGAVKNFQAIKLQTLASS